jgi:hypothetical protein
MVDGDIGGVMAMENPEAIENKDTEGILLDIIIRIIIVAIITVLSEIITKEISVPVQTITMVTGQFPNLYVMTHRMEQSTHKIILER